MRSRRRTLAVVVAGVALLAAACGGDDGDLAADANETRTVEVDMVDIAFEPATLDVDRGETVRFVFTNRGDVAHEAYIGDRQAQTDHEDEMRDRDGDDESDAHGGHGDEAEDAITVEPGESGELTYTFDEADTIEVGCHEPGHYDAGMKITVEVT